MTDADIGLAYRYPMSRTPVRSEQARNALLSPLNFRPVLAFCHSGMNLMGGERRPAFQGGTIDGWDAPVLTRLAGAIAATAMPCPCMICRKRAWSTTSCRPRRCARRPCARSLLA